MNILAFEMAEARIFKEGLRGRIVGRSRGFKP